MSMLRYLGVDVSSIGSRLAGALFTSLVSYNKNYHAVIAENLNLSALFHRPRTLLEWLVGTSYISETSQSNKCQSKAFGSLVKKPTPSA